MTPPVWKFYDPLPLWQVLLIFFGAQIAAIVLVVTLRMALNMAIPDWVSGGIGGAAAVAVTLVLAKKRRGEPRT